MGASLRTKRTIAPTTPKRSPRSTPALIEVKAFAVSRAESPVVSVAKFAMIAIVPSARRTMAERGSALHDLSQLALDGAMRACAADDHGLV